MPIFFPAALLLIVLGLFSFALPGIIQFDDLGNLSELPSVVDWPTAQLWIEQGKAGPLGRPLALATFALQAAEWPNPHAFLAWNIALHGINALLVFWLGLLVARHLRMAEPAACWLAFSAAVIWAVSPFLATSVLFIVQRMALLASTFMLAGLVAYFKLRTAQTGATLGRQLAALLALAVFGLLAMFSKENGALIVLYALVLELLLWQTAPAEHKRKAALALLSLGSVGLLALLLPKGLWGECDELYRGYTMAERLNSQGYIFLDYLRALLAPSSSQLNPFRHQFYIEDHRATWSSWAGIVIWALLMLSPLWAWLLRQRWLALALLWFFGGHIMESGWLNLEPYFAHRNYLPALGLIFVAVMAIFHIKQNAHLAKLALLAYALVLAVVNFNQLSLWGNRPVAAQIWLLEEPRSVRASLNLAHWLNVEQGFPVAVAELDRFIDTERNSVGLRLQSLIAACQINPTGDHSQKVAGVLHAIEMMPHEGWATDLVEDLLKMHNEQGCASVGADEIAVIASTFLSQPSYQCSKHVNHNLLGTLGFLAATEGDAEAGLDFYRQALESSASFGVANLLLDMAVQSGQAEQLPELLAIVEKADRPKGTSKEEWQDLLARYRAAVAQQQNETP